MDDGVRRFSTWVDAFSEQRFLAHWHEMEAEVSRRLQPTFGPDTDKAMLALMKPALYLAWRTCLTDTYGNWSQVEASLRRARVTIPWLPDP